MPEVGVHREFLHRACVQISSPLTGGVSVEAETQHALRFVRLHADTYADEIARALVWRIVDTDDSNDKDRSGAWAILNAVLEECGDPKRDLSRSIVAEKIALFLPYLIGHRWYSTMPRQRSFHGAGTSHDDVDNQGSSSGGAHRHAAASTIDASAYGKVMPASAINGDDLDVVDVRKARELLHFYRGLLAAWKKLWRSDVYQQLREVVRTVEREGNFLTEKGAEYLDIPSTFKDSLWRLCRRSARPSIALHVLYCYGWRHVTEPVNNNNLLKPAAVVLPTTMAEVEALDSAMHPNAKAWMEKLIDCKGGCRLCDTWRHEEANCPCERPFVKTPGSLSASGTGLRGGNSRSLALSRVLSQAPTTFTYMQAVEKLHRYQLNLPLRVPQVLDCITALIQNEKPYEEVLTAFDTVRGAITGSLERHALWLHASYHLLPSKTVFEKPSDDALSPTMERAAGHFIANRRFREWDLLKQSVDVLDGPFRRRTLPSTSRAYIKEIQETCSFFFCLVDGSLPLSYTPKQYARVPEEVVGVAALKDILCKCCLEPFHALECCPSTASSSGNDSEDAKLGPLPKEPWDLQVARIVLEDNDLLDLRYPEEEYRFKEALRRIDTDDRQAKEFRKKELELAVRIIHEGRIPICDVCHIVGHSTRRCVQAARKVLEREGIREVDMRLDLQGTVQKRLRELRKNQRDTESKELRDAADVVLKSGGTGGNGSGAYPSSFMTAIREFDEARVPLAAMRYSADAVQNFLVHINASDLLRHVAPLRDPAFPEVCLFCDSYHHASEACDQARPEESGFLKELSKAGLTLWEYLLKPHYYDERLPTDYMQGKAGVLRLVQQFDEDYAPGGVARQKFIEHNGLESLAAASQLSMGSTYGLSSQKPLGTQRGSPYGASFSQLIAPSPAAPTPTKAAQQQTQHDADILRGLNGISTAGAGGSGGGGSSFLLHGLLGVSEDIEDDMLHNVAERSRLESSSDAGEAAAAAMGSGGEVAVQ